MSNCADRTSRRFGKLTVMFRAQNTISGNTQWLCQCDCGETTIVQGSHLRAGSTYSCGCAKRQLREKGGGHCRHRASSRPNRTREYETWVGIHQRCRNPNAQKYKYYGGRGIFVCERWNTFETFLSDMGPRPAGRYSIGRVDVNGNYEPANCKWVLLRQQS